MQNNKYLLPFMVGASLSMLVCIGCGSNTTGNGATPGNSTVSAISSAGDARFSVTIDGTPVTGGTIDEMQIENSAFVYPARNNGPQTVLFHLVSNKKGDDFYTFRFSLPDKEGEYRATPDNYDQSHTAVTLDFNLKSSNNFARYNSEALTIIISKITSSRISGTFSGVLILSTDTRSQAYKSKVTISEGRFDIPFSTGNIRPE